MFEICLSILVFLGCKNENSRKRCTIYELNHLRHTLHFIIIVILPSYILDGPSLFYTQWSKMCWKSSRTRWLTLISPHEDLIILHNLNLRIRKCDGPTWLQSDEVRISLLTEDMLPQIECSLDRSGPSTQLMCVKSSMPSAFVYLNFQKLCGLIKGNFYLTFDSPFVHPHHAPWFKPFSLCPVLQHQCPKAQALPEQCSLDENRKCPVIDISICSNMRAPCMKHASVWNLDSLLPTMSLCQLS